MTVLPEDHAQIAAGILATAEAAVACARKRAPFLARTKLHGLGLHPSVCAPFALRAVVDETCGLLAHRLRATSCSVHYAEHPEGIVLEGDPSRLGRMLINLVANAIDAYEENRMEDRRIEISTRREHGTVILTV